MVSFTQISPQKPCIHLPLVLSPTRATCSAHPILIDFIGRTKYGDEYRSYSSSLCSLLHPRYLIPFGSKYFLWHPIFAYPHLMFFPQYQRPSFTPTQNRQNYRFVCLNVYILGIENCSTKYSAPKDSKYFVTSICPSNVSYFIFMAQQPLLDQGLLTAENSRSRTDTPLSLGSLCTRDRPVTEISTWQHTTLTTDKHPSPGGIRKRNPSKRAAADPRLKRHSHCDRS